VTAATFQQREQARARAAIAPELLSALEEQAQQPHEPLQFVRDRTTPELAAAKDSMREGVTSSRTANHIFNRQVRRTTALINSSVLANSRAMEQKYAAAQRHVAEELGDSAASSAQAIQQEAAAELGRGLSEALRLARTNNVDEMAVVPLVAAAIPPVNPALGNAAASSVERRSEADAAADAAAALPSAVEGPVHFEAGNSEAGVNTRRSDLGGLATGVADASHAAASSSSAAGGARPSKAGKANRSASPQKQAPRPTKPVSSGTSRRSQVSPPQQRSGGASTRGSAKRTARFTAAGISRGISPLGAAARMAAREQASAPRLALADQN